MSWHLWLGKATAEVNLGDFKLGWNEVNIIPVRFWVGIKRFLLNEKNKTKYYKTCITRWEYNGSYEWEE